MKTNKTYTVEEATKALEHFCSYQERCHKDVEKKLRDLKMIPEAQDYIILHLLQHNFLNEERFAKAYVRGKFNLKKWGKQKILKELRFKNISSYNINSAIDEIDEYKYLETLEELAFKKLKLIQENNPYKKKQKLVQYLYSKGFESNLIYSIVNELIK